MCGLDSFLISVVFSWWSSLKKLNSGIRVEGSCGDRLIRVPVSKVFLTKGQASVSRYVNDSTSNEYLAWNAFAQGGSTNMKGLTLEGEIVGNQSVSVSLTLSKNRKLHII